MLTKHAMLMELILQVNVLNPFFQSGKSFFVWPLKMFSRKTLTGLSLSHSACWLRIGSLKTKLLQPFVRAETKAIMAVMSRFKVPAIFRLENDIEMLVSAVVTFLSLEASLEKLSSSLSHSSSLSKSLPRTSLMSPMTWNERNDFQSLAFHSIDFYWIHFYLP